jgi:hypothetical protein
MIPLAGGAPKQVLPSNNSAGYVISSDGRLAGYESSPLSTTKYEFRSVDLVSHQVSSVIPMHVSDINIASGYSADSRAMAYSILQSGGRTILYQPLDGSVPHTLIDPVPKRIAYLKWSPSGKQLAITRQSSSSDVVLITDQNAKGKN